MAKHSRFSLYLLAGISAYPNIPSALAQDAPAQQETGLISEDASDRIITANTCLSTLLTRTPLATFISSIKTHVIFDAHMELVDGNVMFHNFFSTVRSKSGTVMTMVTDTLVDKDGGMKVFGDISLDKMKQVLEEVPGKLKMCAENIASSKEGGGLAGGVDIHHEGFKVYVGRCENVTWAAYSGQSSGFRTEVNLSHNVAHLEAWKNDGPPTKVDFSLNDSAKVIDKNGSVPVEIVMRHKLSAISDIWACTNMNRGGAGGQLEETPRRTTWRRQVLPNRVEH